MGEADKHTRTHTSHAPGIDLPPCFALLVIG